MSEAEKSSYVKQDGGISVLQQYDIRHTSTGVTYKQMTGTGSVYMNSYQLLDILRKCDLVKSLKELIVISSEAFDQLLLDLASQLSLLGLIQNEESVIEQSRQAYLSMERIKENCEQNTDNEFVEVQSDSDSSDGEVWALGVNSPFDERGRELIKKRRASLRRKSIRDIKKRLAKERLMKQRRSKRVGKIVSECQGIGKEIENFVKDCGVGADAWRRTGILTFDGN